MLLILQEAAILVESRGFFHNITSIAIVAQKATRSFHEHSCQWGRGHPDLLLVY
jgi:hypothetical protein